MSMAKLKSLEGLPTRLGGRVCLGMPAEGRAAADAVLPTGLALLDERLGGGFPRGRVSEVVGRGSSGKLSIALRVLRSALDAEAGPEAAALVDASGTVFPGAPWAAGRLLVVRPGTASDALRALDVLVASAALSAVALDMSGVVPRHGVPEAVQVRLARLARETGTAVLACAERALFGGFSALRLEVAPGPDGCLEVSLRKNKQGAPGSITLPHFGDSTRDSLLPWARVA